MAPVVDTKGAEQLFVVGGTDPKGEPVSKVHAFDVATGAWRTLPSLAMPRACHRAQVLDDGSVLVTGGSGTWPSPATASCELLRPGATKWVNTGDLQKRSCHGMAVAGSRVFVAGGMVDPTQAGFDIIGTCEVFDVAQQCWAAAPALRMARFGLQLLPCKGDFIAAVGGRGPHPSAEMSVEVLDTRQSDLGQWTVLPTPLLFPRIDFAAVVLDATRFLIMGGNRVSARDSSRSFEVFSTEDGEAGAAAANRAGTLPGSQVGCRAALLTVAGAPSVVLAGGNATAWGGSRYGQDIREPAQNDLPVMVVDTETLRIAPAPDELLAMPDVHRQPAICSGFVPTVASGAAVLE